MSEELNLGAAAEEEDERRGGGAAAGGRRADRVSHPLLLALPEKVATKWRGCEKEILPQQRQKWMDILELAAPGRHTITSIKTLDSDLALALLSTSPSS